MIAKFNVPTNKELIERKRLLKESIIKALNECDDFELNYSVDDYFGNECELITYKIEIESDEDFEKEEKKLLIVLKSQLLKEKLIKKIKRKLNTKD